MTATRAQGSTVPPMRSIPTYYRMLLHGQLTRGRLVGLVDGQRRPLRGLEPRVVRRAVDNLCKPERQVEADRRAVIETRDRQLVQVHRRLIG